jgi:hypothetical protein
MPPYASTVSLTDYRIPNLRPHGGSFITTNPMWRTGSFITTSPAWGGGTFITTNPVWRVGSFITTTPTFRPGSIYLASNHPPVPEGQGDVGEWGAKVWGQGPEGADENMDKTPSELAELGITIEVAEEWRDFYERAAAEGQGGETAPARIDLLEHFIHILGEEVL